MDEKDVKLEKKDILFKEIDLIQGCINRMAKNSFYIKGWTITILTAVLAFLNDSVNQILLSVICMVIIIIFWSLDTFYLYQEKLFRMKYEWVRVYRMRSNKHLFDLNPKSKKMRLGKNSSVVSVFFSKTLLLFYGTLFFMAFIMLLVSIVLSFDEEMLFKIMYLLRVLL